MFLSSASTWLSQLILPPTVRSPHPPAFFPTPESQESTFLNRVCQDTLRNTARGNDTTSRSNEEHRAPRRYHLVAQRDRDKKCHFLDPCRHTFPQTPTLSHQSEIVFFFFAISCVCFMFHFSSGCRLSPNSRRDIYVRHFRPPASASGSGLFRAAPRRKPRTGCCSSHATRRSRDRHKPRSGYRVRFQPTSRLFPSFPRTPP